MLQWGSSPRTPLALSSSLGLLGGGSGPLLLRAPLGLLSAGLGRPLLLLLACCFLAFLLLLLGHGRLSLVLRRTLTGRRSLAVRGSRARWPRLSSSVASFSRAAVGGLLSLRRRLALRLRTLLRRGRLLRTTWRRTERLDGRLPQKAKMALKGCDRALP